MATNYYSETYFESLFNLENAAENIHMLIYSALAFFVPFFLAHPQIVVGVIVNAALILGSSYLKGYKLLPVILLPSIAVTLAGLIFGPFTVFLVYLIPFIWIGNALFAYGHRYLSFRKVHWSLSIIMSAALKAALLFLAAFALFSTGVIPAVFLTAMGWMQLVTALIGGFVAIGASRLINLKAKAAKA